jgi:diacylglycerol kinase family enzyme
VAIGNGRHYGGGMTVAENASIDDGKLNIYSLEVGTFWHLVRLLPSLRRGQHDIWEEIRALEGEAFEIRTPDRPRSVSADGEIVTRTPAHFHVRRGAVGVFVP